MKTLPTRILHFTILFMLLAGIPGLCPAETPEPYQKAKQTVLKKYVTAQQAYDRWLNSPEAIHLIDSRTPEEYLYVGHAPMAINIPSQLAVWDAGQGRLVQNDNPDFEKTVRKLFKPTDILMVMCRSGNRSAASVNRLATIGFSNVYSIIDGFEGDKVKDKHSAFLGKRLRNGWKNALAPWTYELVPELVYRSSDPVK